MDVTPDGTLYLADDFNNRVRAVDLKTGIISTVAGVGRLTGNGEVIGEGYAGDGRPAGKAQLFGPRDVAAGPDGAPYIVDNGNRRIRVVGDIRETPTEDTGGGGGGTSIVYNVAIVVILIVAIEVGVVLLRPRRRRPAAGTAPAMSPPLDQPWPSTDPPPSLADQPAPPREQAGPDPDRPSPPADQPAIGQEHPPPPAWHPGTEQQDALGGLAFAVGPFFVSMGIETSTTLNGVLIEYSYFNVLGLLAGIVAVVIAVQVARRDRIDEWMPP